MSNRALWISLCLVSACACSSAPVDTPLVDVPPLPEPNPFWHADGEQIVDGDGERVVIRGVNVGGWLIWENWMWGGGWQGETTMRAKFVEAAGEAEADRFAQRVHDTFITVDDIGAINDLGFNVIRLNINHSLVEEDANPDTLQPDGLRRLDDIVRWCEAYGIGVLLDLHAAPGGQSWTYMNDPDPTGLLWHAADKRERTVKVWRMLAEHFADDATIVGYDLLNEPWPSSDEDLFALYVDITAAITEVDPRRRRRTAHTSRASRA